jgi:hypothetical protein
MATDENTPDWLVERAALSEMPEGEPAPTAAQLEALKQSNAAILAELPPAQVAAEIDRRLRVARAARTVTRRRWLATCCTATAAAAVVLLAVRSDPPARRDALSAERVKGAAYLVIHRKRGGDIVKLSRRDAEARAGDLLQLSYVAGGQRHGAIVSVDGGGQVIVHQKVVALTQGRAVALAHSYELDDAPDFEQFFLVTGARPFEMHLVVSAAERWAAQRRDTRPPELPLPRYFQQSAFFVRKVR